jgi:hypothetical protein
MDIFALNYCIVVLLERYIDMGSAGDNEKKGCTHEFKVTEHVKQMAVET